ncbi:MAG: hypothetical protein QG597_213 [Actinomycetota bacterium]|nr:hypothetical protein [Actinomycetota bacterium]
MSVQPRRDNGQYGTVPAAAPVAARAMPTPVAPTSTTAASLTGALAQLTRPAVPCTGYTVDGDRCQRTTTNTDERCGLCGGGIDQWTVRPAASKTALLRDASPGDAVVCVDSDRAELVGSVYSVHDKSSSELLVAVDAPWRDGQTRSRIIATGKQVTLDADGAGWTVDHFGMTAHYRLAASAAHAVALREHLNLDQAREQARLREHARDAARAAKHAAEQEASHARWEADKAAWNQPCRNPCGNVAMYRCQLCQTCQDAYDQTRARAKEAATRTRTLTADGVGDLRAAHPDGPNGRVRIVDGPGPGTIGRLAVSTNDDLLFMPPRNTRRGTRLFTDRHGRHGSDPRQIWAVDARGRDTVLLYDRDEVTAVVAFGGRPAVDQALADLTPEQAATARQIMLEDFTGTLDELAAVARLV